jgi:hypothetical protein
MDTKFREVMCDEHGICGDCEYCNGNDAQLGRINVLTAGPRAESMCPAR